MTWDLVTAWFTPQGVLAAGMIANAYIALRSSRQVEKVKERTDRTVGAIVGLAADMKDLKVNTNHIQDQLNVANLAVGKAAGRDEMRAETEAKPGG